MYKLQDLKFNDFSLDDEDMLKACLRMFLDLDLIERFHIKYEVYIYVFIKSISINVIDYDRNCTLE